MDIRFYIDPEMRYPHIYRHGVEEYEVEDVLLDAGEYRPSRGNSRVANGQTRAGRYLRVVYRIDPATNSISVITAYDLRGNDLAAYRRRQRRKGRGAR